MPSTLCSLSHAFVAGLPLSPPRRPRHRSLIPRRNKHPTCAAAKLLVVELAELLRDKKSTPSELDSFSERVRVDRASAKDTTFLLYSSPLGYKSAMKTIHDAGVVEPDALSALDGLELYQRRYQTPDPYWEKTVTKNWDPKPTRWVVSQFFGKELKDTSESEDEPNRLLFKAGDGAYESEELCGRVGAKFAEMGIGARVKPLGEEGLIAVIPATGSVAEVVAFCQMMLRIPEEATYVFGSGALVASCVVGKSNLGICSADSLTAREDLRDRVYVSGKEGVDAVVEGVLHHAIF